jgi:tetratricopeptide (TPR) repeat protein
VTRRHEGTGRRRTDDPAVSWPAGGVSAADARLHPSQRLLELGRRCDRSGRVDEAIRAYEAAVAAAGPSSACAQPMAEALRRLAVLLHRRGQGKQAEEAGLRSLEAATTARDTLLQAEALNTLGGLDLMQEQLDRAHGYLERALALSVPWPELHGRVQQNLGILASLRGDRSTAMVHYEHSLKAFEAAGNEQGCAVAHHNLGMICADEHRWEEADQYFERGLRTAQSVGDDHLRGLCLSNRVEVLIALRRFDAAQAAAETALAIFEQLRAPAAIADVQRMLGVVFRETNRLSLAQSRLEAAVELAREAGSSVSQSEALCEAGRLHGRLGHLDDAIDCLVRAARPLSEVPTTMTEPGILSGRYPTLVSAWCELLASHDPSAAAHADRVAGIAAKMAAGLGLSAEQQVTTHLAARLHALGRLRPSGQSDDTFALDTTRLLGDAPCFAAIAGLIGEMGTLGVRLSPCGQVVSVADRYDHLVRPDGGASSRAHALATLAAEQDGWAPGMYDALERATDGTKGTPADHPPPGPSAGLGSAR